ncbi:hypothetical protein BGAL_0775g00020 [Botrytis galanthina]|uniref:Uncharacterized protein n=1 Tax=Botrytis galanthina TaxID=278940 RepID=A0A4S8QTJ1_9HELO|nr:hypothetical protein BGAL_0775g00020 [Botrytis galanthina]
MGRYSAQKWGGGGVSRGLGCTYLKGITIHNEESEGEGKNDVLVECEVVGGLGKRNVVLRDYITPSHPPSEKKKIFKFTLSSIFPIPSHYALEQNSPSTIPQNPNSNSNSKQKQKQGKQKKELTPPGTMKRRTGEVLAICEHSKVNIVGVELPGGAKEKKEEGKGKESKL